MDNNKFSHAFFINGETEVNRMGYGAMQLTGNGVFGDMPDRNKGIQVLREAIKLGVNFIDTAEAYGPETNETLIADALYPYPDNLFIATKGGFERPGPNQWTADGRPERIAKAIDGSLKRLKVECIDLWQLHRIDSKVPVEDTLEPVAKAVQAGKIRYVGLSEVNIEQVQQAEKIVPIVSVQNHYNLEQRMWEEVVDYTAQRNIAFIPWFPLASGPEKLKNLTEELASKYFATPAQIALAWLMNRSPNIILIPGTRSLEHLKENMESVKIRLTESEIKELTED